MSSQGGRGGGQKLPILLSKKTTKRGGGGQKSIQLLTPRTQIPKVQTIHLALLSFCFAQLSYPIILFVFGFLGKIRLFELVKHAMLTKIKKKKVSLTSFCNFTYQKIYIRQISIIAQIFCSQKKPFLTRNPKLLADLFYLENYGSYIHFEDWFTRFEMSQNLRSLNFDNSMDFLYSKEAIFDKESKTTCRSFLS